MGGCRRTVVVAACAIVCAGLVTGCAGSPSSTSASPATSDVAPSSAATPGSGSYPEGASPDTPRCQDASQAAVDAVNATISNDAPGAASSVEWLSAAPDPDHAVWLLAGLIDTTSSEGGYIVAWATTSDPTSSSFDGTLRSVGGSTGAISSAPALQFPDLKEPGSFPPLVFSCIQSHPR